MRPGSALLFSVAVASTLCGSAAPARAGEKEWILALQPGFAFVKIDDRIAWGGGGGIDASYGVTDNLAVRVTGAVTEHLLDPKRDPTTMKLTAPGGPVTAYHAGAGITYAVDILRLVPYFDVSVGLLGLVQPTDKGPKPTFDFGVEIGLGVDYLINRRVAVGFVVRYHAYLTSITQIPVYMYAGPRVAIHWGG